MAENKIEVYTLGNFFVRKNNNIITEKNIRSHKLWSIFKILISSPEKIFTAEELMERLDLSLELIDAKNAVQNLIYRLRKVLANNEKYKAEKYILFKNDGYTFNWNSEHYIDFILFENLCKKSEGSLKNKNYKKVFEYSLDAIKVYKGNFLDENKDISWVIQKRAYLRRLYLEQICIICDLLIQKKDYIKVEEICEKALNTDPFEEEIHYYLIKSLIKQNKIKKAKLHYQYILNLFSLHQIKLSSHLTNLLKLIKPQDKNQKEEVGAIKNKLNNFGNKKGICLIDKNTFNYFSLLTLRKQTRENFSVFLLSVSLNIDFNDKDKKYYQENIDYLEDIFFQTLRSSDIICKWTKIQYLILFSEVDLFTIQEIIDRIRQKFYRSDLPHEIIINLDCIKL